MGCSEMANIHIVLLATILITVRAGSRSYPSSCSRCGGNQYSTGHQLGAAVANAIGGKVSHIKGFFDGLGPGGGGCGGCSSSCGSPGCGSSYVSGPSSCTSCYSGCGSGGCGGSSSGFSSSNTVIVVQQPSSSHGTSYSSSHSSSLSSSHSSSLSKYDPAAYPNCQCDYLFNSAGQGNC